MLVPITAVVVTTEWSTSVVFNVYEPETLSDDYRKDLEQANELEARRQEGLRLLEVQEMLVQRLIAGRGSLPEVTKELLMMHQNHPAWMAVIRAEYPGNSDEEKTARNVIGWVAFELSLSNPDKQAEVLARLESELECLVAPNQQTVP
jgi:hypothetical protein